MAAVARRARQGNGEGKTGRENPDLLKGDQMAKNKFWHGATGRDPKTKTKTNKAGSLAPRQTSENSDGHRKHPKHPNKRGSSLG
jgi:purine nucleoside permease